MIRTIALTTSLALAGCSSDGNVDWSKVGTGVLAVGAAALLVGAAAAAAQPAYTPSYAPVTTACNSWGHYTRCTTW